MPKRHTDRSAPRMLASGLLLVCLGTLLLAWQSAEAADSVALTWDPPTKRVNGTELAPEEIDHYQAQCGEERRDTDSNEITFELPPGEYECYARVYDTEGRVSAWSEALTATVQAPPEAPQNIRVTVTVEIGGAQ